MTMKPSCEHVEYASTRLISNCATAIVAEKIAVMQPIHITKSITHLPGSAVNNGNIRPTMNTPAATIVAAWISALTGVGPSIASGNHTCNGNCALLPIAPQNSINAMKLAMDNPDQPVSPASRLASSHAPPPG